MTNQVPMTNPEPAAMTQQSSFVLVASAFIPHLSFWFRHFSLRKPADSLFNQPDFLS
jgi:hypothetical protein